MALYSAIQKFITKDGAPVAGASCVVFVDGGVTQPTLFASRTGGALSNPFLTDSQGNALCYVAPGRYKMIVTKDAEQVTFEGIEVGPVSLTGTFAEGGVVSDPDQWFTDQYNNQWTWTGALNKTVSPGEDPNTVAGWELVLEGDKEPSKPQVLSFAGGGKIKRPFNYIEDSQLNRWRWTGPLPHTVAIGTDPNSDPLYVPIGPKSLMGAKELLNIPGTVQVVRGLCTDLEKGGGQFYYDPLIPWSEHDVGLIIAKGAIDAWDGTVADRFTLINWTGTGFGCFVRLWAGALAPYVCLDPHWFGAVGKAEDGYIDTVAFAKCGDVALAKNTSVQVGAGKYKGAFDFGRGFPFRGSGKLETVFVRDPGDSAAYTVRFHSTGVNSSDNEMGSFCVDGEGAKVGVGLQVGETTGSPLSAIRGKLYDISVKGFERNIYIKNAVQCSFYDIYSSLGVFGIDFLSEATAQALAFYNFSTRLNDTGIRAASGHFVQWYNTVCESNNINGIVYTTGLLSGPGSHTFHGGNLENNGFNPPVGTASQLITQIYLDMQSAIAATKGMDIVFDNMVINSPVGAYDVYANRAQNAYFRRCKFTVPADGGFSINKLNFNTGTNAVKVFLEDCSTIQVRANTSMYSAMPALFAATGGPYGFIYRYTAEGKTYSNELLDRSVGHVTTTDLTSFDVRGVSVIVADTAAGNLNINSFSNGINNQTLRIIKPNSPNTVTLPHNGTGAQKIFTPDTLSKVLSARNGIELVCYNNVWYFAGA